MFSTLYLKIVAIIVVVATIFGAGWYVNGLRWTAKYDVIVTQDAQASEKARRDADTANAAIATAYNTQLTATEKTYETQLATGRAAADRLVASLRNYQNKHSGSPVSASPGPAGPVHAASPEPGSDSGIAEAARRAIEACESDAATLTGLQAERASLNKAK